MEKVVLTEEDVPGAVLMNDPSKCSFLEFERSLECHGMKRTGKKRELIDRVRGCLTINNSVGPKNRRQNMVQFEKDAVRK